MFDVGLLASFGAGIVSFHGPVAFKIARARNTRSPPSSTSRAITSKPSPSPGRAPWASV